MVVYHDDITQRKLAEIGLQMANDLLELQATTDPLTRIANRRSFDDHLEREWRRHERALAPFSAAMIDVDCFKEFNDSQGHLAGDDCLRSIAQTIKKTLRRPGDVVARYGGDEFSVILPATDEAGAKAVGERILESVRDLSIPHPASRVERRIVTVSLGCATIVPPRSSSPSLLLHQADLALYEAKRQGRDRLLNDREPATPP